MIVALCVVGISAAISTVTTVVILAAENAFADIIFRAQATPVLEGVTLVLTDS